MPDNKITKEALVNAISTLSLSFKEVSEDLTNIAELVGNLDISTQPTLPPTPPVEPPVGPLPDKPSEPELVTGTPYLNRLVCRVVGERLGLVEVHTR